MEADLLAISGEPASQLIHKLMNGAPDAMVVIDASGRIVFYNLMAERLFGYVAAETLGHEVELLVPERYRGLHLGHRARYSQEPSVRPMDTGRELYGLRKDGTEFSIEISLSPIHTAGGLLTCASIRDISDRKHRELELQRIQTHLLNAVESIQGAFAIYDLYDRLVLCNSNYRLLFSVVVAGPLENRSGTELMERCAHAGVFRLIGESPETFIARWRECVAGLRFSLDATTSDGRKLRIAERTTTNGGRVTTLSDITADVERSEQLQSAHALAEAASRAKSEFLASMSHELRTPLNAILGFAQLLKRDRKTPLSDRQHERIGHVLSSGEHLLHLIDDVLDLASIEAGRVCVSLLSVPLSAVLEEVTSTLDPIAQQNGISLQLHTPEAPLPEVLADRTRLKQILMNFGSNAIKYGRLNGRVSISARMLPHAVRICVEDNGVGIAVNQQAKLFQPFQRAGQESGPIEGTGIGLALSKRLAELMRGSVGFTSQLGQGSVFWIDLTLPRTAALPIERITPSEPVFDPPRPRSDPRATVVYIEDNPSNVSFMEDFFADYKRVDLVTAPSAEIGLALVRELRPRVVIMDLNLPGMNGVDATLQLADWPQTRDIPVIALSAAPMLQDPLRVRGAGFYRCLKKPVAVDELIRTLEELLAPQ
jgi:PAS domain S-box-containing protein